MKRTSFWLVGIVFCFIASSAVAKEVVIVTSFPKELFETYKKTFESKNPGITVVINSKQTNAGVTYLRETKAKPEADIFWVSAPDAFQTLEVRRDCSKSTHRPKRSWRVSRQRSAVFRFTIPTANISALRSVATA